MAETAWRMEARGDAALALISREPFSLQQHRRLLACVERIDAARPAYVLDVVPGHNEILVIFDAGAAEAADLQPWLAKVAQEQPPGPRLQSSELLRVPVCFDADFALDLPAVAARLSLTTAQVVEAFTRPVYQCTVVGFRPGFPYLEGLPGELELPRHATPRAHVPQGSVAVAGRQAGIYPVDGPGGWHILGRTSVPLFTPMQSTPCLIMPGMRVKFHAVGDDSLPRRRP